MTIDIQDILTQRLERLRAAPLPYSEFVDRALARLPARPEPIGLVPCSRTLRRLEFPIVFAIALGVLALGRFALDLVPSFGGPVADLIGLGATAGLITALYAHLVTERRNDVLGPPSPRRVHRRMAPASRVSPLSGGTPLLHGRGAC